MVKTEIVTITAQRPLPEYVEDLESGRYKCITHCTKSEFDPEKIDEAKTGIREEWEKLEGVTVESVDIVQVKDLKPLTPNTSGLRMPLES